ncbi:phosphate ABC transporter, substrate-binding component [synthetic Mycoplasma mycoides JCVI-syn1.0]|uniref:Phosphate ABC transporter substrate-binding protein n=1 Tax=Mycoplasma mycoides subsp. capri TaxID=40477 RepID=A0AB38GGW5_MYCMC|nr:phosphate ABC transporter substrate-binding protein [Mycoplasma mycoides]ADH21940.1 phosphate ABC transporter, substrate-binding component [synthetic Mycoplasma mycoides JCVI-syn1.0]AMW76501.1 PstS: phosphate binding protein [synthetic bacterium JCVI-Syn3.0]AMW76964.1 PstS: phosphate binding protein [synthetic bacterium JCVI-Syn2.0]AVX54787.1 Phosphate ABC transporter substrate-binding protein [synthetic bacterium JCVI-Syn3A]QWN46027.1 phosphate ABC transporter substrate-binding protein [sy
MRKIKESDNKTKKQFKHFFTNKKSLLFLNLCVLFIVSIWIWTFVSIKSNLINIGGSASADLVLQKLIKEYQKQTNKKFNYSSTGSGAGARNVINQTYSIGFISKSQNDLSIPKEIRNNLYDDLTEFEKINDELSKKQVFNHLKTFKDKYHYIDFVKDSIVFVYNIKNTGLTNQQIDQIRFNVLNNKISSDSQKALHKIYTNNKQSDLISWKEFYKLLTNKDENNISSLIKVRPYSTNSGSGTRSSFEQISGLKDNNKKIGQAVNEYNSNGAIFTQLDASDGSFGFVSMQYAQDLKKYPNLRSVIIKQNNQEWNLNKRNDNLLTYPLSRPFVALYKFTDNQKLNDDILDFVYWFSYSNDQKVKKIYDHLGLIRKVSN